MSPMLVPSTKGMYLVVQVKVCLFGLYAVMAEMRIMLLLG